MTSGFSAASSSLLITRRPTSTSVMRTRSRVTPHAPGPGSPPAPPPPLALDAPTPLALDVPPLALDALPPLALDAPPPLALDAPAPLAADAPPPLALDAPPPLALDAPPPLALDALPPDSPTQPGGKVTRTKEQRTRMYRLGISPRYRRRGRAASRGDLPVNR
ncbi:hypothetical protein WME90_28405 [Sorangium sp. So ce375]|uniref:hypothetical protein n=1 Tax=Sorangium sp. So ce375 TaxID=3133306 RepID=UPI003F5AF1D2